MVSQLPKPKNNQGFPWNEEVSPLKYDNNFHYPKITIITPTLNQGKYIEATIRSVLLQNYPNLEYIIIDGNSTDQTIEIIKKYSNWISYWISEPDRGQTHAINKGIAHATGDIIGWLNSDDQLLPNALLKVSSFFSINPSGNFLHGEAIIEDISSGVQTITKSKKTDLELKYLSSFPYPQPSCFFRTRLIRKTGELDESFQMTMDFDLFVRFALVTNFHHTPDVLTKFLRHSASKTFKYTTTWDSERKIVFSKLLRTIKVPEKYKVALFKLNSYIEGTERYKTERSFSEKDVKKIIYFFLLDSIYFNYHGTKNYKNCYKISKWLIINYHNNFNHYILKVFFKSLLLKNNKIRSVFLGKSYPDSNL